MLSEYRGELLWRDLAWDERLEREHPILAMVLYLALGGLAFAAVLMVAASIGRWPA